MGMGSWIRRALGLGRYQRPRRYTRLHVTPLESRRMLNADFALNAGVSLTLDNFNQLVDENLSISDDGTCYIFTLDEGNWIGTDVPGVVEASGNVLRMDKAVADALTSGILIDDNGNTGAGIDVDVNFDDADFSALAGVLEFDSVGNVTQTAATTLNVRALDVDALSIDLQQNNDFDKVLAISAGTVELVDVDDLLVSGVTAGDAVDIAADELMVDGAVDAMGTIDLGGSTSIETTVAGTIDSNGSDVTLKSNSITLGEAVISTGAALGDTVTFLPLDVTDTIGLGSAGGGTLNLSEATLDQVQGGANGFSEVVIGYPGIGMAGTEQQGDITLDDGGDGLTINTDLSLRLRAGSTDAVDPGGVQILDTLSLDGGGLFVEGSGSTMLLAADVLTAGGPVAINDSVLVDGVRTIETDGGDAVAAGPVTITGAIDGANAGGTDTLTIDAAMGASDGAGDAAVDLQGPVEGDAATNNIPGGADLEGLTIRAGQVDLASVRVEGPLDVTGTNIDLNGSTYRVDENGGAETIDFDGPIDLTTNVAVIGAGGAGDDVTFNGTIDGAFGLTVDAGAAGDVDFPGNIGGTTPLTSLGVANSDETTFAADATVNGPISVVAQSLIDVMADLTAMGDVTMDANTGNFNMAAGSSITTPADVTVSADTISLDTSVTPALISATGVASTVTLAPDTPAQNIQLGAGAVAGFALTDAELNTIEATRVRIGTGSALAPFGGATAGTITFVGSFAADAAFATEFIELRTKSTVTATAGAVDLSSGGATRGLVVRSGMAGGGAGTGAVDFSVAAHNLNTVAVTTDGVDGNGTGTDSDVTLRDAVDGLTIGTVDGLAGISTRAGNVSVTSVSANSDIDVEAPIVNSGSGMVTLTADDSIRFDEAGDVTSSGGGNVSVTANANAAAGDDGNVIQMADDGLGDSAEIDAGSGEILLTTVGGGLGGNVTLGRLVTNNGGANAVQINTDAGVIDGGDSEGEDVDAPGGTLTIQSQTGVGVADALDTRVSVVDISNTGGGAAGTIEIDETDNLLIDSIVQGANANVRITAGGFIDELTDDNLTDIVTSAQLIVSAGGPIGASGGAGITGTGPLDIDVGSVEAHVTPGPGGIFLKNSDGDASGLTLVDLDTAAGDIQVRSTDAIEAVDVAAAGDATLIADTGDVTVGSVSATANVAITATAGSIDEIAPGDAGVDVSGVGLTLTARDEIGGGVDASGLEIAGTSLVAMSTTAGDIVLTETDAINLTNVTTVDGDVTVSAGGGIGVGTVTAGGAGNRVTLAAGGAMTDLNGAADNVMAEEAVLTAGAGIASAADPLETVLERLEASGGTGGAHLANTGDLVLGDIGAGLVDGNGTPVAMTVSGGDLSVASDATLTVNGAVTNTGDGDLTLTAGDDLELNANLFTGDGLAGNSDGKIRGTAGANIVVAPGILVTTDTGQISDAYFAPLVVDIRVPTDFGDPDVQTDVDSLGRTFVEVTIQDPAGLNFEVLIDWMDGTVDQYPPTVLTSPVVTNDVFFTTATAPPVDGGIAYLLPHTYFGNPDEENPADNIPFTVLVRADFRGSGGDDNGIQFVENAALGGDVVSGSGDGELTVPGDGLFAIIVVQPTTIEVNPGRPPLVLGLNEQFVPPTVQEFRAPDDAIAAIDTRATEDTVVVVRVFAPDGTVKRDVVFPLEMLQDLPALYEKLQSGYFEIYLRDGRTGRLRLIVPKFFLREGEVVDEAELRNEAGNPGAARPRAVPPDPVPPPGTEPPGEHRGDGRRAEQTAPREQTADAAVEEAAASAADVPAEPGSDAADEPGQTRAAGALVGGVVLTSVLRRRRGDAGGWAERVDRVFEESWRDEFTNPGRRSA